MKYLYCPFTGKKRSTMRFIETARIREIEKTINEIQDIKCKIKMRYAYIEGLKTGAKLVTPL
jgi:hypothetical protein